MKAFTLIGSKNPSIGEYMSHRVRVQDRKREIEKLKLDIEQGFYWEDEPDRQYLPQSYKGTHAMNKEEKMKYKRMMWYGFLTIIGIVVAYIVIINVMGI